MSSVDDLGEFSTLIDELQRHASESKTLQKILDDTLRVLREIGSASCIRENQEILDVFMSFNDLPVELVVDKLPSIVIMGGQPSSRVAVANRLLGPDVLPAPCRNAAWHTLQFLDTNCVHNFGSANTALWSWVNSVPLENLELGFDLETLREAEIVSVSGSSSKSEIKPTVPVVNILMSHPVLRAGSQLVVCGDHSSVNTVQFAVAGVIPIIIFVVSGGELSEKDVSLLQCLQQTNSYDAVFFVKVTDSGDTLEKNGDFIGARSPDIQHQLLSLGFLSSSPDGCDTEMAFCVAVDHESSDAEAQLP